MKNICIKSVIILLFILLVNVAGDKPSLKFGLDLATMNKLILEKLPIILTADRTIPGNHISTKFWLIPLNITYNDIIVSKVIYN